MNIAIDLHDTITYDVGRFRELINAFYFSGHKIFIISGTPESDREYVKKKLYEFAISFNTILLGFNYEKSEMTHEHFLKMREWKLKLCQENHIDIYIDDNPYYVSHLTNHGILCLQPILCDRYIEEWSKKDPYFTCNLQKEQFTFLDDTKMERKV